jgi:hypothetical protein
MSIPGSRNYRVVLRGELGDQFGFEGMRLERRAGFTVLTGTLRDQADLIGLIERFQDLGIELVSIEPEGEASSGERGAGQIQTG